jgi:hypothetical protein
VVADGTERWINPVATPMPRSPSRTCDLTPEVASPNCQLGPTLASVGDHLVEHIDILQELLGVLAVRIDIDGPFYEAVRARRQRSYRFAQFRGIGHGFCPPSR